MRRAALRCIWRSTSDAASSARLVDGDRDMKRVLGFKRLGLVDRAARHVQQVLHAIQVSGSFVQVCSH